MNSGNHWVNCNDNLCGGKVSPCNSCDKNNACDFSNDERFDPSKAIPAGVKYLSDKINECGNDPWKGINKYNSGDNCDAPTNEGYTDKIKNYYNLWSDCIKQSQITITTTPKPGDPGYCASLKEKTPPYTCVYGQGGCYNNNECDQTVSYPENGGTYKLECRNMKDINIKICCPLSNLPKSDENCKAEFDKWKNAIK